jgi:hypothetical protein
MIGSLEVARQQISCRPFRVLLCEAVSEVIALASSLSRQVLRSC